MPDEHLDLVLDASELTDLFDVAALITPCPDEQVWLVTHATRAGWDGERLAAEGAVEPWMKRAHAAPLGIFEDTDG